MKQKINKKVKKIETVGWAIVNLKHRNPFHWSYVGNPLIYANKREATVERMEDETVIKVKITQI